MSSKPPITLSSDLDPWDRQPGESHRQYSRFQTFMELGRGRTLKQAAEMLHGLGDKITYRTLMQYAYEYRWSDRAEAHDRDQDRLERERLLVLRREMLARHRKLAAGMLGKAITSLQNLQPAQMTPTDITRFVKLATDLERVALGEPERTVAVTGAGGGPITVDDFSQYTPAERRARLEQITTELSRRAALHDDEDDD
ncbi:hypothetical protein [Micromonospora sp. WMMC273]|uniref:hypothetical protein n=1 Tax=Micromonospora sp. WMMC273 TaxID=3015157 RepID=UPI0022B6C772|nr:hypothetical protein [Micromonospora sp. WMMC273]MCZ7478926.1 hypothetical protein [Micromonospora sp. WMMC273]MCZ7478987.1 hypothetical protein [Micromonospora sp. WMMC273]